MDGRQIPLDQILFASWATNNGRRFRWGSFARFFFLGSQKVHGSHILAVLQTTRQHDLGGPKLTDKKNYSKSDCPLAFKRLTPAGMFCSRALHRPRRTRIGLCHRDGLLESALMGHALALRVQLTWLGH